jgi:glycosyltransferase involved in cell wall biosynthesis
MNVAGEGVRVVHVVRTLGKSGGMEKNLLRITTALSKPSMKHTIVYLDDRSDALTFPSFVPVHRVLARPRDPRMIARIAEQLAALSPTVIHARNWASWPDTAAARLLVAPRVPLVFSYHGMEASTVLPIERLKFCAVAKVTTRMFAVSHAARRLLVERYGLARERISVIENGVDTDRFSPAGGGRKRSGRFIVGAVGRVFRVKNLPMLMRAVKLLIDRGVDLELRVAGEGPESDNVRALADALRLGDRFSLAGFVEDVPAFLRALDVYALSSDIEANPNALLEAMSVGLACVSTDVGNVRDLLDEGRSGVLIAPGDEAGLAQAIEALLRDPERRCSLGDRARDRILSRYSQARMFEKYEALYRAPRTATFDDA